jgi:pimeloyl-ACP methyl ester carboxylesterase
MPYIDVNGIQLYFEEHGRGTPLLLLHGGAGTIDADSGWAKLIPSLSETYRTIAVEHRGHGRTNNPLSGLSYELIADDIKALIMELGLAPAHIAGMSDGGIAGLQLALTHPDLVRSLIGVGVNYRVDERIRATLQTFTPDVVAQQYPEWAAEMARIHDVGREPGYWRILVQQVGENARNNPTWNEDDLRSITTPTLLIAGDDDPFGNLEQMVVMRRTMPRSELLIVNNAWHTPQWTHPHLVGPAIVDFLSRQ